MDEKQLMELKQKIDAAKTTVSELKGQLVVLMNQLLNDWACSSIEEAEDKLKEMDIQIDKLDTTIAKGLKNLERTIEIEGVV